MADDEAESRATSGVSEQQLAANRRNAERSTGPKTEAGKATSSRNAVKHGIFASPTPIRRGPFAEDPEEHERDLRAVVIGLFPEDDLEYALALRVGGMFIRLARLDRFAAAAIASQSGFDSLGAEFVDDNEKEQFLDQAAGEAATRLFEKSVDTAERLYNRLSRELAQALAVVTMDVAEGPRMS